MSAADAQNIAQIEKLIPQIEASAHSAVSPKGAVGGYQITRIAAREYHIDYSRLKDPAYNAAAGAKIISALYKRYHGDLPSILVAYNAGPTVAARWRLHGQSGPLPIETQNYLAKAASLGYGGGWYRTSQTPLARPDLLEPLKAQEAAKPRHNTELMDQMTVTAPRLGEDGGTSTP